MKLPYTAIVLCAILGCRDPRTIPNEKPFTKPEYAVLTGTRSIEDSVKSRYPLAKPQEFKTEEFETLISNLPNLIEEAPDADAERPEDVAEVINNLKLGRYNIQLIGFTSEGTSYILVNALDKRRAIPNWREAYQSVTDGGPSYWFCLYDVSKRKIVMFLIHGRA